MLPLNKSFWALVSIWNNFFRSELGRNLDMAPKVSQFLRGKILGTKKFEHLNCFSAGCQCQFLGE